MQRGTGFSDMDAGHLTLFWVFTVGFSDFFLWSPHETMKKKLSKWHQILRGFRKFKNKQILKVTAVYAIWNPKSVRCPASISENPVPYFFCCHRCFMVIRRGSFTQKGWTLNTNQRLGTWKRDKNIYKIFNWKKVDFFLFFYLHFSWLYGSWHQQRILEK